MDSGADILEIGVCLRALEISIINDETQIDITGNEETYWVSEGPARVVRFCLTEQSSSESSSVGTSGSIAAGSSLSSSRGGLLPLRN